MSVPPAVPDPREFALQLAVVAERLDERSAHAVARVEAASAAVTRDVTRAVDALTAEQARAASGREAEVVARARALRFAAIGLAVVGLLAVVAPTMAVWVVQRDLATRQPDQALLDAISQADVVLCDGRLCARFDPEGQGMDATGYRPVAPRPPQSGR